MAEGNRSSRSLPGTNRNEHSVYGCKGDRAGYRRGCKCFAARVAAAKYAQAYRAKVNSAGYIRAKLIALGISYSREHAGA